MHITVHPWSLEVGASYPLGDNEDIGASPGFMNSIKTPLALKHLSHYAPFLSTTLIASPLLQVLGTIPVKCVRKDTGSWVSPLPHLHGLIV